MAHLSTLAARVLDYDRTGFLDDELLALYRHVLLPRMVEEKMLLLLRQGRITKWFSGIGQEAVSVAAAYTTTTEDYLFPLHRNLGLFTTRGLPLGRLFQQWMGKPGGYTQGRDRSFHFGAPEEKVVGMISHLGAMLGVADGTALAQKLKGTSNVSVAFSGDGGASEGDFHEALNVAAVWGLPVVFVIENNGYGLSTPSAEQFRCKQFIDKGIGYGLEALQVNGNNLLDTIRAFREAVAYAREEQRPILLEAMTFRLRGHEEASGTKYVPAELQDYWAERDPVLNFEHFLTEEGLLYGQAVEETRASFKQLINRTWEEAEAAPAVQVSLAKELGDVYAPALSVKEAPPAAGSREIRLVDAISEGLRQAMEEDDKLVLMGQDIAGYGGVFKITDGFLAQFGPERVRNTPLCESAILGCALGLSLEGYPCLVEMQFADFVSCGFNQIVNNLAKTHYRWSQPVNVTVRMPTGAGVAAGPYHSQSNEAWFFHVPGLKIVYPSTAYDAKGLLLSSLREPNPVLFFEHKYLYRREVGAVPEVAYSLPIGKAAVRKAGQDIAVITYGMGVNWALAAQEALPELSLHILDLRTLLPWDQEAVEAAVRQTGKAVVLHEDTLTGGIGAELAAWIAEHCFESLDAPVRRVGSLDTPVPFQAALEQQFLPEQRFRQALTELANY